MFKLNDLKAIKIGLASPETIRSWGKGEVTKPETINYRSQKPEPDGLFCEKIFGPAKDYECHCGRYKKSSFAGKTCDKCGVEVTLKAVRRERMGYINLAFPCTHFWYVKGSPSKMALTLNVTPKELSDVVYFGSHIVVNPGNSKILTYRQVLDQREAREIFKNVISEEILGLKVNAETGEETEIPGQAKVEKGSADYAHALTIIELLKTPAQPFDFITIGKFITKYIGSEFGIGAEAILRLLKEIDLDKEIDAVAQELKKTNKENQKRIQAIKRLDVLQSFKSSGIKPEWMVLTVIPVIPPDLRPMMQLDGGRFASSDLNDLYRQVIIKNNRLKREMENYAPTIMLLNEKRMLQESVDALIDNERRSKPATNTNQGGTALKSLSSFLKGKQGRFRQNLLGKRVDYSGRSVIAVGPELDMDQCGLPREMAVQLFRPFIACYLTHKEEYNITSQRTADELIAKKDQRVYDAINEICSNHPVLLNRAPTLHRLGIQAFRPILIEGKAIRLHPLVCPGFNADFDGDQMAVHVPLSRQAQAEAMSLMLANKNILKPSDGEPICVPSQDMIYGNYYLTLEDDEKLQESYAKYYEKFGDVETAEKFRSYKQYEGKVFSDAATAIRAYQNGYISLRTRIYIPGASMNKIDFSDRQKHAYLLTTVGKLIFNQIFSDDFPYINFPKKSDKEQEKKSFKANLERTSEEFFVTLKEAYDAVIASGKFKEGDDFNPLREYAHIQGLRIPISKGTVKTLMSYIFQHYNADAVKTAKIMDAFKNQGFDYCTKSGLTISLDDIEPLEKREEILAKGDASVAKIEEQAEQGLLDDSTDQRHELIVDTWNKIKSQDMTAALNERVKSAPRNPMFMMMESGARGSTDNYMQLIGMKGCMLDSTGRAIEVPVKNCYADGLTVSEYFTSTHGTRKNGADTALKTADSGYLTRKLVDVSHNVVIREDDCHCDHGFVVKEMRNDQGKVIATLYSRLVGRYPMHDIHHPVSGELIVSADQLINENIASAIVDAGIKEVEIRSVLSCTSKEGICVKCYGRNLATGKIAEIGDTVGIMAAQSIGEPGTQLTLKNFHTGGVAGQQDITTGLPRVTELLEVRKPKDKFSALISTISGTIEAIEEVGSRFSFTIKNDVEEQTLLSKPKSIVATNSETGAPLQKGDRVKAGQMLTRGHINTNDLLECADLATVRNYIIKEVKDVYSANGIAIADKHLEIIVRQMTSRVYIVHSGDTKMLPGQRVSVLDFTKNNDSAIRHGNNPAVGRPILRGITKAALDSDSFLSSASFQQTTSVLTDAAIKGRVDSLVGLKENVMVGKLIPAGTGIKPIVEISSREDEDGNPLPSSYRKSSEQLLK